MSKFTTVQEGRHAIRATLSDYHANAYGGDGLAGATVLVEGAGHLLRGRKGVEQAEQIVILTAVRELIEEAMKLCTAAKRRDLREILKQAKMDTTALLSRIKSRKPVDKERENQILASLEFSTSDEEAVS